MPFEYKPSEETCKRKEHTITELENAIRQVKEGGVYLRKPSINYGIDRSTLRRYKLNEKKTVSIKSHKYLLFEEKLLVEYLLSCSKMHYGLTRKQALQLAFQFTEAN